jgi:RNA polymerase sigma factor (TIGR02999 family)
MSDVTKLLLAIDDGDAKAADRLLPLVYHELRRLAAAKLSKENPGHSVQPTVLVHEAYLRLVDVQNPQQWNGRGHFFSAAAEAMRRILVERARRKQSRKYGRVIEHTAVNDLPDRGADRTLDLIALDQALTEFESQWPEKAALVKLRYFAGFTTAEAADALGLSVRTAERTWTFAKSWLLQAIEGDS